MRLRPCLSVYLLSRAHHQVLIIFFMMAKIYTFPQKALRSYCLNDVIQDHLNEWTSVKFSSLTLNKNYRRLSSARVIVNEEGHHIIMMVVCSPS